ncbi:MAG: cob(I)yrinic acid a,c-diamide adenosyltransferase [Methanomassiliicoccales archaeon]|nr:cob(I)yrinic acid a,c-diamide adenosyltransferase [Methanomassiliicoccales archaeon]
MKEQLGLVHVYTGDGKGKTTAALGLCARAVGHGYTALMVQFMKTGGTYGENFLRLPGLTVIPSGHDCLVYSKGITQQDRDKAAEGLDLARQALSEGEYDIVVLDEVNVAIKFGLLQVEEVVEVVRSRHPGVEVVLTGRKAPQELLDMADYISEMTAVRHPYTKGVLSRQGVDR